MEGPIHRLFPRVFRRLSRRAWLPVGVSMFAALAVPRAEARQENSRIEVRAVVGYAGFIDESLLDHAVLGALTRIPVSKRMAVAPEILYMRQSGRHDDISVTVGAFWTVWGDSTTEAYLAGSGGVLHSRFEFPGAPSPRFSSNEFTGGGGFGVRFHWTDRVVLTPEFRLGWEPLVRATVGIGYELGF